MTDVPNDEQVPVRDERPQPDDDLVSGEFASRSAAAERLPLTERADAFSTLHDELRTRLESGGRASV